MICLYWRAGTAALRSRGAPRALGHSHSPGSAVYFMSSTDLGLLSLQNGLEGICFRDGSSSWLSACLAILLHDYGLRDYVYPLSNHRLLSPINVFPVGFCRQRAACGEQWAC